MSITKAQNRSTVSYQQLRETGDTDNAYLQKEKKQSATLPPYSESEYRCHFFTSSFELKLKMNLSLGGNKSSEFHTTAANLVHIGRILKYRPKIM
jgi:hypothetical protein